MASLQAGSPVESISSVQTPKSACIYLDRIEKEKKKKKRGFILARSRMK
jgi:hypothetical protein